MIREHGRERGCRRVTPQTRREREITQRTERMPSLAVVRPVAKGRLRPGVVVWARIPFDDLDADKVRPAVVKCLAGRAVTLFPGSSALSRHRYPGRYHELGDLDTAGLSRATGVRLAALTIDVMEVLGIAGTLAEIDATALLRPGDALPDAA